MFGNDLTTAELQFLRIPAAVTAVWIVILLCLAPFSIHRKELVRTIPKYTLRLVLAVLLAPWFTVAMVIGLSYAESERAAVAKSPYTSLLIMGAYVTAGISVALGISLAEDLSKAKRRLKRQSISGDAHAA